MSEYRWRFRTIDIPKPILNGTRYKLGCFGSGIAVGAIWEHALVNLFGYTRGSTLVFLAVAVIFAWQAVDLYFAGKRLAIQEAELRKLLNENIGPELTEEEENELR